MPNKPNNSNNGELQPYDPNTGEYEENSSSNSLFNYYARKLGGDKNKYPLSFPPLNFPPEYKRDYFNEEIDWTDVIVSDSKMNFLIDISSNKKRFLIFRDRMGYNENNINDLKQQIITNAKNFKVFLCKLVDEHGYRVKIYMPILYADKSKQLIIRTGWILKEGEKPRFITAYYEENFERNLKDEIR